MVAREIKILVTFKCYWCVIPRPCSYMNPLWLLLIFHFPFWPFLKLQIWCQNLKGKRYLIGSIPTYISFLHVCPKVLSVRTHLYNNYFTFSCYFGGWLAYCFFFPHASRVIMNPVISTQIFQSGSSKRENPVLGLTAYSFQMH
jgi:hypothetical protein